MYSKTVEIQCSMFEKCSKIEKSFVLVTSEFCGVEYCRINGTVIMYCIFCMYSRLD